MPIIAEPLEHATILNVDDNEDARVSLSMFLRIHGLNVQEASTGEQALEFAKDRPDVVILDVILPDRNGFEICRQIKSDPVTTATPVLMLSGEAVSSDDHVAGLEGGADGYLTKPADPTLVLAHVRALLRVHQAEKIRRRASEVLETTSDCFITIDRDWRYTYVNPQAERVLHRSRSELLGKTLWEIIPEVPGSNRGREYRRAMAEGTSTELEEFYPALGAWIEVRGFPNEDGMTFVFRDVTERHRLQEQYRQAQKMEAFGQLAGGVAHDFNNLLTIINGYGDIALDCLPADHPAHNLVNEIRKAGDRAANLTKQLLAFTRKAVIAPRVLDLNAVVRDVQQMLKSLIGEDVELITHLAPSLGFVKADQGQVEQVILNLSANARDAMPRGGRIVIETGNERFDQPKLLGGRRVPAGDYVVLGVRDSGIGMTSEIQARIFEPFFTTKGPGKGTGLGLASVHGIVQQSGGHVAVTSEVGVGSVFHVFLPRVDAPLQPARPPSGFLSLAQGSETVLLVEDEEALRTLGRSVLRHAGYTVLEAGRGEDALRLVERHARAIDLIVTDVVLPGMNGRQLVEIVRARYPGLKVLYLSGHTDDAVLRRGVEETQVHFLHKPFTPNGLTKKVRDVLDTVASPGVSAATLTSTPLPRT
jgi:two-component system cell cycle sensor histidine kinase/response regulator CckA